MPRKETRWVQKDTYPTRAPVRKGGLVTGSVVSRVGQLEDTALCPPGKALPVSLRPRHVARPLPPLLDPGTLQLGPERRLCYSPQGGALPTSGEEKCTERGLL